ncbi:copper amine oxidase N-terminal domain-containing protein [Moorellaceae bacterium AZ2]
MLKTRKKWLSILITLAMLVGLMVPFAGPAAAVGTVYTTLTAPPVEDDTENVALGSFQIEIDPIYLTEKSSAIIELPSDYEIHAVTVNGSVYTGEKPLIIYDPTKASNDLISKYTSDSSYKKIEKTSSAEGVTYLKDSAEPGGVVKVTVDKFTDRSFRLTLEDPGSGYTAAAGSKFRMQIGFPDVKVPAGASGDVKVTITNISGQLVSGSVAVATVAGGGLTVSVIDDENFSDAGGWVKIRVEETVAGKLNEKDQLKLELPDGFEWADNVGKDGAVPPENSSEDPVTVVFGNLLANHIVFNPDGDTLKINLDNDDNKSKERSAFDFWAKIEVTDTDEAEYGDVVAKVKGDYTVSPSEIVVGTYGDYEATIEAEDSGVVAYAGQNDQDVSDIVIKEQLKGSLIAGRTITLTLPENARWYRFDDQVIYTELNSGDEVDRDAGLVLKFSGLQGTDDRTAKFVIESTDSTGSRTESTDEAELKIENIGVSLKAGVTGDLKVKVGGSAGLSGEITIGKVVNPVTVTAEKTNVQLGKSEQAAGKIVISEYAAGAIDTDDGNARLTLTLPEGVKFSSKPTVTVTEGDIEVESVSVTEADDGRDDAVLKIKFKGDSDEASTIEITDIYYDIDRTFGEGDIKVEVGGDALVQTNTEGYPDEDPFFEDADYVVKVANATCVTPAPPETRQTAVFTISSTTYTVNGVEATMDVAPYIKDGRTYLPVRYVAYALGISPENVIWDGVKATFIGQGRVVQVTPGSAILSINGAPVTMDVVAEVVSGRVMVPFRWVAQAFGAQVDWDEANQTVTMNL